MKGLIKLISISEKYFNNSKLTFKSSAETDFVSQGDKALNENRLNAALSSYQKALEESPDNEKVNRKLGKAYFRLKDYKNAEENFNKYLEKNPDDVDCLIELGETKQQQGLYKKAAENFEKAYELDKTNDLAKRSLMSAQNYNLGLYAPEKAFREKVEYAKKNLQDAVNLTVKYLGADYMKELSDVSFQFGKTSTMSGTSNIAQYENAAKSITVSDSYIYAAPEVIAAYTIHESIHGHDKDAYTSIREEQDAYEAAAKYWIKNSKGIKDPEMDYAAGLYKKSPASLRERVEEIYTLRDPSIAKTSPNHPPAKKNHLLKRSNAASQSLSEYSIIA